MYIEFKINKVIVFVKGVNMGTKWSKHPYFIFAFLCIINISTLAIAICIYVFTRESAANFAMSIFMLFIPIVAGAFVFYNIISHFLEIKAYYKAK